MKTERQGWAYLEHRFEAINSDLQNVQDSKILGQVVLGFDRCAERLTEDVVASLVLGAAVPRQLSWKPKRS